MFTRFADKFYLTHGQRSYALGCAAIVVLTALVTVLVMMGLDAPYTLQLSATNYTYWVIFAGALSGGVGLFIARGWMGALGALGFARAIVGSIIIAIVASVVAGTLTVPVGGTIYAPLLTVSAFMAKPWLAAVWFGGTLGGHYLMSSLAAERSDGEVYTPERRLATEELSALSRANLYRRN
ncbi:hypothetical protein [Yoonia algicola]|uniref:Uncharacterized protein n=1 Tax=Yoonia algicola TaxID=3137368 RepID=A0AAN0M3V4_9RHOB